MTAKALMRFIAGILSSFLLGCGYFYPTNVRFEYSDEWKIAGKRDFRLIVGYYSLPARDTSQEIDRSLEKILSEQMRISPVCSHGYKITKIGAYEGGGYHYIEGLCNDKSNGEDSNHE